MTGRKEQLDRLEQLYNSDVNCITVLYGRRGIGKTALLKEFVQGKRYACFDAGETTVAQLLDILNSQAEMFLEAGKRAESYSDFFENLCDSGIKVIIFENFRNLIKADREFIDAAVQYTKSAKANKLMLVFTSSLVAWVENSMVKEMGKAAFSINAFIKLKALDYADFVSFFPQLSGLELLTVFAITGGVPGYMVKYNADHTLKTNICSLFLEENGALRDEVMLFLKEEFREIGVYNTILRLLSLNKNKLNELHECTGFGRDKLSVYLKNMMEREIVEKKYSIDDGNRRLTRKGLYGISDGMVNFWFRYIYPYYGMGSMVKPEDVYSGYIEGSLNEFVKEAYIKIACEFIDIMNEAHRLPFSVEKKGRWYGKSGDIHMIYANEKNEALAVCVCVADGPFEVEEFNGLLQNSAMTGYDVKAYYLFAVNGFDPRIRGNAAESLVYCINIDEL